MGDNAAEPLEHGLMDGRVRLVQAKRGYRAGMDAALLAAACDADEGDTVLEAGCGVGAVLIMAAVRRQAARFVGLERDADAVELAIANIELNGLKNRVSAKLGEIADPPAATEFDAALANPPFFDDETALRGPAPERRGAWIADGGLAVWTDFLTKSVREGGSVTVIHRADRLADLFALLARRSGSFQVRPIQPFSDAPASRVLVRTRRGGRAPLRLLPSLVLHPRDGAKYTTSAEAILRGEADLPWL